MRGRGHKNCIWCDNNVFRDVNGAFLACTECKSYVVYTDKVDAIEYALSKWNEIKITIPLRLVLPPGEIVDSKYIKYKNLCLNGKFHFRVKKFDEDVYSILNYLNFLQSATHENSRFYYPVIFDITFLPDFEKYSVSLDLVDEDDEYLNFYFTQHHGNEIKIVDVLNNDVPTPTLFPVYNLYDIFSNWKEVWRSRKTPPIIEKGLKKLLL